MNVLEGHLSATDLRFGIVVGRFNELVTRRLLDGALDALRRSGAADEAITVAWVPGAVEIPPIATRMAASARFDAVIALGAVIRGETGHYDAVVQMVSAGVARAAADTGVAVAFGVLTTDTLDQALDRAGGKAGNKGAEAAMTAIEMANLVARLEVG